MKKLLLFFLLVSVGFSAAADLILVRRNAGNTSFEQITFAPTASAVLGFDGSKNLTNLVIGTDLQAYDSDLAYLAGFTPAANVKSILNAADYAAIRTLLALVIGTNVQAYDADLDTYAGITPASDVQGILSAADYAAIRTLLAVGGTSTTNTYTAMQTFSAGVTVPWTSASDGGTVLLAAGDKRFITTFDDDTDFTLPTPVEGTSIELSLEACDGNAIATFSANVYRYGEADSPGTTLTPSAGNHKIRLEYLNSRWTLIDTVTSTSSGLESTDIDTIGELETIVGGTNIIISTEIDSIGEIEALAPGLNIIASTEIDTNAELRTITVGLGAAVVGGSFSSPTTTDPLALTAADCYGFIRFYGATGEIDLPAGVAGMNGVIYNTGSFTITIDPNASEVIVRDGTSQTGGVSFTLSSGAGNYVALLFDGTQWVTLGYKGTLTEGS